MKKMEKKYLLVLVFAALIGGGLWAQENEEEVTANEAVSEQPAAQEEVRERRADSDEPHKHEQFDMLLGLNYGFGISPSFLSFYVQLLQGELYAGNYAVYLALGLTYEVYLINWLSINTGMLIKPDIYLILDQDLEEDLSFTDVMAMPVCITIPVMAHINIPKAEWLYLGIGMEFNLPLFGIYEGLASAIAEERFDTKGPAFIGMPIDIGFDFTQPSRGGMRLLFRITPEFHEKGVTVPIGLTWQIWNWNLGNKG